MKTRLLLAALVAVASAPLTSPAQAFNCPRPTGVVCAAYAEVCAATPADGPVQTLDRVFHTACRSFD